MLSALLITGILGAVAPGQESALADASIPERWVLGEAFRVELRYTGAPGGSQLAAWQLTPAAFELQGKPLAERANQATIDLAAGDKISLELDLAPWLKPGAGLELGLAGSGQEPQRLRCYEPVPLGTDYLSMAVEALAGHQVLMQTLQGELLFELWPEVAPAHVRNWLDLVQSGFYAGLQFHRVSPNFMIQGGCPNTRSDRRDSWGLGVGPRTVPLELSERKHEKGVLSMARGPEPDSASCQFFVITRESPQLDGQYSTFGKLLTGYGALARIGNAPGVVRNGTITPNQPQRITKAIVLRELTATR